MSCFSFICNKNFKTKLNFYLCCAIPFQANLPGNFLSKARWNISVNRSVLRRKAQETGSGIKTLKISQFFTQMRTALKWALAGKYHSYLHRRIHVQKIIQRTLAENLQLDLPCLIKMMTVQWPLSLSVSYPHIAQETCKCLHLCKYFLIPDRSHWKFGIVKVFNLFFCCF